MEYHHITTEELETLLETSATHGLPQQQIKKRLEKYGANIIAHDEGTPRYKIFFRQLTNPLMSILIIAAVASALIGELGDAFVIGIAITLNVIVGYIQEWKAETTARALRKYHTKHSVVIREGKTSVIDSSNLIPGDLVVLTSGDQVPADIRLTSINRLQIEEAVLTGESLPINKNTTVIPEKTLTANRLNMAFAGTYIVNGKGQGIVVSTGTHTELGKIASLVTTTESTLTPLQRQINKLSWFLGTLLVSIALLVTSIGLLYRLTIHEFFSLAVALSVAAVPEGLLITMTVILTIGMRRMLKRKALVRNLLAAETLGSVSVVCADKTGTLTEGKLGLMQVVTTTDTINLSKTDKTSPQEDESLKHLLGLGLLNNDASKTKSGVIGDPLEIALIKSATQLKIKQKTIKQAHPRLEELPFSAETKLMATIHQDNSQKLLIIKGAPEVVFAHCRGVTQYLQKQAEKLTSEGFRLIAIATKFGKQFDINKLPKNCQLKGLFCFSDPLRKNAAQTVKTMQDAGVKVVMVTGDHPSTAISVAKRVGLNANKENVINGTELSEMSDKELSKRITKTSIFARVAPHDKIRIVRAWQKHGKTTAMTGDGINDAPALKAADIGVAQGSGSDVAQSIAGIVLLDDNLATIGAAIHEGRIIFDNIRKVIVYFLADGFSQIVLLAGALIFKLPIPLLPTQILWVNIISDGLPSMALTAEPGEEGIMLEKPRHKNEPILNTEMKTLIFIIGIVTDIGLFATFAYVLQRGIALDHVRTIMFHAIAVDSLFYVFATRTLRRSLFKTNPFSNMWLIGAVLVSFAMQISCSAIPVVSKIMRLVHLSTLEWCLIGALALVKLIAIEITKLFFRIKRTTSKTLA